MLQKILFVSLIAVSNFLFGCQKKERPPISKQIKNIKVEEVVLAPKTQHKSKKNNDYPVIEEKEPNDHPIWAQNLPPNTVVKGYINKPRKYQGKLYPDRDVYLFEIPKNHKKIVWAKLKGIPNIDTYIEVYRKKGPDRIYAQNVAPKGGDEIIPNLTLSPGKYFFKLGQRWTTNDFKFDLKHPYEFVWTMKDIVPGIEAEPNDSRLKPNILKPGVITYARIGSSTDRDVYTLPVNKTVKIDIKLPPTLPAVLSFWPKKGKKHSWRMYLKKGANLTLNRLKILPKYQYLVISSYKNKYDLKHHYSISIGYEPKGSNFETEPNNTKQSANIISSKEIKGFLSYQGDVDYYLLNIKEPSLLNLNLQLSKNIKVFFKIGELQKQGQNISIKKRFIPKGQLYLSIRPLTKENFSSIPYSIKLKLEKAGENTEKEPNDTKKQANLIKPDVAIHGYITPKTDKDLYYFRLWGSIKSPPIVEITLTGTVGINPILRLLDPWGNIVTEDKSGVFTGLRKISTPIHPGLKYYIEIKDLKGLNESPDVPYELKLHKKDDYIIP